MMNWSRQQENADSYAKRMDTSAKTLREADQSLKASINNLGNESNNRNPWLKLRTPANSQIQRVR